LSGAGAVCFAVFLSERRPARTKGRNEPNKNDDDENEPVEAESRATYAGRENAMLHRVMRRAVWRFGSEIHGHDVTLRS
jgi:hypothetical protein